MPDLTGQLIYPNRNRQLFFALEPVEKAAAAALGCYLRAQTFRIHPGCPGVGELSRTRELRLVRIYDDFPSAQTKLEYPSASIVPAGAVEHDGSLTVSPREETYDPEAGTVVWVLGEVTGLLQLDIWCDSVASADAFYSRLPALLSPGEAMSGLLLRGPPGYLSAPMRYLLINRERRDQPESAYAHERRVSCTIRFDAPDLDLRCAGKLMQPQLNTTVVEPGTPPAAL
jgi:hypothetical protein